MQYYDKLVRAEPCAEYERDRFLRISRLMTSTKVVTATSSRTRRTTMMAIVKFRLEDSNEQKSSTFISNSWLAV